jgi:hypothetical protein
MVGEGFQGLDRLMPVLNQNGLLVGAINGVLHKPCVSKVGNGFLIKA